MVVLFGGRSSEHTISCVSAASVLAHLDPQRYEVIPIGITPDGSWVSGPKDLADLEIVDRRLPTVAASDRTVALSTDPSRLGEIIELSAVGPAGDGYVPELIGSADVVFPVLHGAYGEDGTIQGLLEIASLPYVGSGVFAGAAAMDKEFTKKLLAAAGLPVGRQVVLRRGTPTLSAADRESLGLPVFVKPARGGSSIGISRVDRWEDLDAAVAEARRHDPKVIVEAGIDGREVECGVLESADGSVRASVLAEIRLQSGSGSEFYDFDSKYLDDVCEFDIPARLDSSVSDAVREMAIEAFRALDCQGLARVDFFVTADGPVINEVNTMPGFTPSSMYPRMWQETGVDYATLLTTLIDTAIARGVGLR